MITLFFESCNDIKKIFLGVSYCRLLCFLYFTILTLVLISGCSMLVPAQKSTNPTHSTTSPNCIEGVIINEDGDVVPSINLFLYKLTAPDSESAVLKTGPVLLMTKSDQNGRFQFSNLSTGNYNVEAKASETLKAIKTKISLLEEGKNIGNLILAQTGMLSGRVLLANKSTHLGIFVFIPGTSYLAITDTQGAFVITNVPAGTFDVAFLKENYITQTLSDVTIYPKETKTLETVC